MKTNGSKRVIFFLLTTLLLLSVPAAALAADEETRTVAYIDYNNFIVEQPDGTYTGYGADYLNKIAAYTGWAYTFVDMDWPTAYEAVKEGTVDFYCVAKLTEERQADFDFSLYPVCNEDMNLYALPERELYYEDFAAFDGLRIGMLAQSGEIGYFEQYAKDNGFSYTLVEYPMNDVAVKALQNGEVDAIALVNYSVSGDFKLVGNFGVSPAYMMSCDDSAYMEEFSRAQERLFFDDPTYTQELEERYYGESQRHACVLLTREEAEYIENAGTLRVALSADMAPIEYYDENTDAFMGVTVDLYNRISALTGLTFEFVRRADMPTLVSQMESGEVQLTGALAQTPQVANALHVEQTKSFSKSSTSLVTKDIEKLSADSVVAVPADYPQFAETARQNGYANIVEYDTFEACVKAVYTGDADLAYLISICEGYLLDHVQYTALRSMLLADRDRGISLGVCTHCDPLLLSIINKGVSAISASEVNEMMVLSTAAAKPEQTAADYFAKNWLVFLIVGALVMALVVFAVIRSEKARQQQILNRKLQKQHDFLQHLYDTVPCGIFQYSYEKPHVILNYNRACAKIYGYEEELPFVGQQPDGVVKEGTEEEFQTKFDLCEQSEAPIMYTWPITRRDGSEGCMECMMDVVETEQGKVFQEVFIDVTEAQRAQLLANALAAAEKADAAKNQFLSSVSHEMRTPLNAIIGFIELAKGADAEKTANYLAFSDIAAKQLLSVINDVLDMSSIESGKMKIAETLFDFKHLLSSLTNIYGTQCRQKGLTFETKITTPTEDWLLGDELRLNQILMNLLGNAVKFTEAGSISLTISETAKDDKKVFMRFQVADTGCGMSAEMKERLFKPFEQENATTAKKYGGSGLGLSIVKNLVGMMDGSISAQSRQGEGTVFTVDLPFKISELKQNFNLPDRIDALRVLAVDDKASELAYMGVVLSRMGVRHTCAESGTEAMNALKEGEAENGPYNVCLIDWRMPELNGLETTKMIRAKYGEDVVVIVISAYDFQQAGESAREAGANLFISKTIFQSSLFDLFTTLTAGSIAKTTEKIQVRDFAGKRVLLAEDNKLNQIVAEGYLAKHNVACELAENGQIAVDMFLASAPGHYDAILMDIQMPLLNGFEATKAIRTSSHPEAKTIQIIAQTADAFNEDIAKSLSAGMNDHVAKPIEPDALVKALQKAFNGR